MIFLRLTLVMILLPVCLTASFSQTTISTASNPKILSKSEMRVSLEDYFRRSAGLGFSGAVLVAKDGEVLIRKGYGWADVKRQIPIAPDTIFDIGSAVKSFTATAVMQLEEQGKLNTSDKITKYFEGVPADKTEITIHQLLTHTSGLFFDYFYDAATPQERDIMKDREKYIKGVLSYPLEFKPGEGRAYSNSGFSLLAIIIEKVSGESYEQYVRGHLFKPAGMTETGYYIPRNLNRVARGYNDGDTDFGYPWETQWDKQTPLWDLKGNGGMLSTLDDMYKWLAAIKDNKIISQKSKDKKLTVYHERGNQAYGWFVSKIENKTFVWSGGDAVPQGWNVELRWYKDDDLIAVVLTNKRIRAGSIRRPASAHLLDIALLNKPPQLPAFVELEKEKLRGLEGTYKLESGATFHVKAREAAIGASKPKPVLIISGEGQQAIDLLFSANQLPGLTKLSHELNEKTAAFIEALRKNDIAALKTILPADKSPDDVIKRWNDFIVQNGELEKIEILGTSPLNQSGVQTFARLKFKKTQGVYKVTWRDQKLHEQEEDRLQPAITAYLRKSFTVFPLNLAFLPQSETDFATYDLFKGRTINVSFNADKSLIFKTKDGDVIARKVVKPN